MSKGNAERVAQLRWGKPLGRVPTDKARARLAKFLRALADDIEADQMHMARSDNYPHRGVAR